MYLAQNMAGRGFKGHTVNIKTDFLFLVQTYVVIAFDCKQALDIAHAATQVKESCLYDSENAGSEFLAEKVKSFCDEFPNVPDWCEMTTNGEMK